MHYSRKKPYRTVLFQGLISIAAVVFVLLLVEVFLRVIGYNPMSPFLKSQEKKFFFRLSTDRYLHYEPNPGFRGKFHKVKIRINSAGFRGPEFNMKKGTHFRIIVLGDSIIFALKFEEQDTFVGILGKDLKQINPECQVLNFGVDGYDTLQEVLFLKKNGLKLFPDLVLVAYCLNDIGVIPMDSRTLHALVNPEWPYYFHFRTGQWLYFKFRKLELIEEMKNQMKGSYGSEAYYSDLFPPVEKDKYLDKNFRQIRRNQEFFHKSGVKSRFVVSDQGKLWLNQYLSLKNIGKIRYSFDRLQKMSEDHGFEVIIVIVPFFYKVNGEYLDLPAHNIVRHEAVKCGFEVIDMYKPFERFGLESLTLEGVHLNLKGQKIFARIMAKKLKSKLKPGHGASHKIL